MKSILLCLALALVGGCSGDDKYAADNSATAPDNTARNARDKSGDTVTPMDQSESEADRAITQAVRKALMDDAALSTNAKNVKVVTQNGKVTLRGVVETAEEKKNIAAKVRTLPGVVSCDDQLEVKPN
jgi:hyperosmotically inducible periplasmic protein